LDGGNKNAHREVLGKFIGNRIFVGQKDNKKVLWMRKRSYEVRQCLWYRRFGMIQTCIAPQFQLVSLSVN